MVEALSDTVQTHTFLKKEARRSDSSLQWFPTNAREQTIAAMLLAVQHAHGTVFLESDPGVGTTTCLSEWRRRYMQSDGPVWFLDGRDPDTALKLDHALMKCMVALPATNTEHPVIVLDHASSIRWELLSTWMRRVKGGMAEEHRDVRWIVVGDGELRQHLTQLFPDEQVVTLTFQPFTANESQRFLLQRGFDITLSNAQAVHGQSNGNPQRMFEVLKDMNCSARVVDQPQRNNPIIRRIHKGSSAIFISALLFVGIVGGAIALYFTMLDDPPLVTGQVLESIDPPSSVSPNDELDIESEEGNNTNLGPIGSVVAPMVPEAPSPQATPSEESRLRDEVSDAATPPSIGVNASQNSVQSSTDDTRVGVEAVASAGASGTIELPPGGRSVPVQSSAEWLAAQDPSHFFVQLTTGRVAADVDKFVEGLRPELPSTRSIPFKRSGRQAYAVVMGPYERFTDAQTALSNLPQAIRSNEPWIRTVRQLQVNPKEISTP